MDRISPANDIWMDDMNVFLLNVSSTQCHDIKGNYNLSNSILIHFDVFFFTSSILFCVVVLVCFWIVTHLEEFTKCISGHFILPLETDLNYANFFNKISWISKILYFLIQTPSRLMLFYRIKSLLPFFHKYTIASSSPLPTLMRMF
jgi:hypothetical protein